MGIAAFILLVAMLAAGRMYMVPLPDSYLPWLRWRSLKDLPGSKTPLVALGWAASASVLPVIGSWDIFFSRTSDWFYIAAGMVFLAHSPLRLA